ncbi:endonuclease/exonuclease/phosphatase family protein [Limimaricola variabilis]|uniref:endonuclease/exonuclease/phosphatase family protein n=1 Tax=Limimaricola variabilis TaxID=1492771 RepID=UPI002AC990C6|nr:endonuclease/exonuclease/phosphatase family protein [Limimaricola variabilis]WPY93736.1 endonuclease/exonuclease/phosphatase family protein [Limimaricola variabilis]
MRGARLGALLSTLALPLTAEPIRIASYDPELSRDGPGLLLRDLQRGEDPQIAAMARIIAHAAPDILLLTGVDRDAQGATLDALAARLQAEGAPEYSYRLAPPSNAGLASGLDLDGDGRTDGARDSHGYGRFTGDGAMALLSRFPLRLERDLTGLLWRDLPGAEQPAIEGTPFPSAEAQAARRLSSAGHWVVRAETPSGPLRLLAFAATPPVFDGPEDLNGLRNRDEIRLWQSLMDGELGPAPAPPFVILGLANLDPADGAGLREAMRALLDDPRLVDPLPGSEGGRAAADPAHAGDPSHDTADWDAPPDGPGNLRVDYVLPSRDGLAVIDAGVVWPATGPLAEAAARASAHRLVWVDLELE